MNKRAIPTPCTTCGRAKNDGRAECNSCRVRRYRQDPEKLARDRERTALWKLEHRLAELQNVTPPDSQQASPHLEGQMERAGSSRSSHERTAA